jgi:hypothetical protein
MSGPTFSPLAPDLWGMIGPQFIGQIVGIQSDKSISS